MHPSNAGRSPSDIERASSDTKRAPTNIARALTDRAPASTGATRVRRVGSTWEILAPAKLNLFLEVLGSRPDGFHALETLMVPVRVYDQLRWQDNNSPASDDGVTLQVYRASRNSIGNGSIGNGSLGNGALSNDFRTNDDRSGAARFGRPVPDEPVLNEPLLRDVDNNLVLRAARLLAADAGIAPRGRFDLIKRIPIQAGMGGGSSDAAAALLLANQAWGIGYSRRQLLPLAAQLGSDVPFFLSRGAAVCRGRGEIVEPIGGLPRLHFVVAKPEAGLSTADVFANLRQNAATSESPTKTPRGQLSQLIERLQDGNIGAACQAMTNRLEIAAGPLAPWLARLRASFTRLGCRGHFMTGSGSAYVGVMRSATQARSIARRLVCMNHPTGLNLGIVFATSNC